MAINKEIVDTLRQMALERRKPSEMAKFLVERFGDNRIVAIAHFKEAFSLSVKDASVLGAWRGFPQANWSDEMIDAALQPFVKSPDSG